MDFETSKDPLSRALMPWFQRLALAALGLLMLAFMASMLNLFLGEERTVPARYLGHEVRVGRNLNTHLFRFESEDGRSYLLKTSQSAAAGVLKTVGHKGDAVELVVDGLFWPDVRGLRRGDDVLRPNL
ncbi:MAG: hypothetical protein HY319_09850 [Armatimonadetes bacterium]|nr:hypothetical protein [Armatimonadota bacterium]